VFDLSPESVVSHYPEKDRRSIVNFWKSSQTVVDSDHYDPLPTDYQEVYPLYDAFRDPKNLPRMDPNESIRQQ